MKVARHLDDVLTRRTRISIETWDRGVSAAIPVASLMAPILGWSEEQQRKEVEHYLARVEAERASQQQPDDETAGQRAHGCTRDRPAGLSSTSKRHWAHHSNFTPDPRVGRGSHNSNCYRPVANGGSGTLM